MKKWVCKVCGYIYEGPEAPVECPVCHAKNAFEEVKGELKLAAEQGVYTYLNLLTYPGVNDCEQEVENLLTLVRECQVKAIQIRNLNIDPQTMQGILQTVQGEALGIPAFLQILETELPEVEIGNYTKPLRG